MTFSRDRQPAGRRGVVAKAVARPRAPSSNGSIPLPRGAHSLGRERVAEIQRARVIAAMTELVRERGVADVTVAHVIGRAGVSRRTFYEHFENRDACLLAAFEHAVDRAAAVVLPAYEGAGAGSARGGAAVAGADTDTRAAWQDQIRAGLGALLVFLDEEPTLGGLCVVDALAAKPPVGERRARVVAELVDAVHRGGVGSGRSAGRGRTAGSAGSAGRRPARIVAEGVVGAVLGVVHARLCEPAPKPLAGLLNQLMAIIVLPYRGAAAAARELERRSPRRRDRATIASDPLRGLNMRLTYRTVRVMLAVGEHPQASSREIADAAGVADQGQISKLLWRLEGLGLIANGTRAPVRGEPNTWGLTDRGREVEHAIRAQVGP